MCRYRDVDKRIEKRKRKARKSKGDEEEDEYAAAFLEYLAQAISYIYQWHTDVPMDKDAELAVKKAAMRILEMDERLTEVTEFCNCLQGGPLKFTELRKRKPLTKTVLTYFQF